VWSFYQDISQIERDYPKSWETFIGNSACIQLIAAKDKKTADYFSSYMGNKTVKTTSQGSSVSTGGQHGSSSRSTTTGEMGRPLMTPDEIRSMPMNEMLVIFPKLGNYRQFKMEYYKDARFNGMYRPDPIRQSEYPAPVPAQPLEVFEPENSPPTPSEKYARWAAIGFLVLGCYRLLMTIGLLLHLYRDWAHTVGDRFMLSLIFFAIAGIFYWMSRPKPRKPRWFIDKEGFLVFA
jgi:hypothetical protein